MDKKTSTAAADPIAALTRELKTARETIRYLDENTRGIVDSIRAGIVIIDPLNHHIVYANPEAVRMIGLPKDKLLDRVCHNFICPNEIGSCPITDKGQTADNSERILLTGHGRSIPILKTVTSINYQGHTHLLESFLDISHLKSLQRDFQERVKELNCIYAISDLIEKTDSIPDLLQKSVEQMPQGWYYPEYTCARISLDGKEFKTSNFRETEWRLSADMAVESQPHGFVEVRYLERMPEMDEGPFLKEERNLIDAIADRLGRVIERKLLEKKSRDTLHFLQTLVNTIPNPIYYKDTKGIYLGCNKAFEDFMGFKKEELVGKSVYEISPRELAEKYDEMDSAMFEKKEDRQVYEYQVKYADGSLHDVIFNKAVYRDTEGETAGLVGVLVDITERKRVEEKIRHMATHDMLTDLPTLMTARDRLSVAVSKAKRGEKKVAVMFMDLNGFKAVNDSLGHAAGDCVLKEVAQRISLCVRQSDTVARVGGDEFLFIADGLQAREEAARIAEKIIQAVSQPVVYHGQRLSLGISIGIAFYPDDSEDMDQLIKKSDQAMYRAKNTGNSGFCFNE